MFIIYKTKTGALGSTYVNATQSNVDKVVDDGIATARLPDLPWLRWVALDRDHAAASVNLKRITVSEWNAGGIVIAPESERE